MTDTTEKSEISAINQCRTELIVMLDDDRMKVELRKEDKATVEQVIEYLNLYKNVVRASYKKN